MQLRIGSLDIPMDALRTLCQHWQIDELAVFGSALRQDFQPESDIDVLVTFRDGSRWTLLDFVQMQDDFSALFGRQVDLVDKRALIRRQERPANQHILSTAQVIYAA
ncbi:MAG: nucleotidyltransferase family protein [Anaerolineae bacterium]